MHDLIFAAAVLGVSANYAAAQQECTDISDPAERLECFDEAANGGTAEASGESVGAKYRAFLEWAGRDVPGRIFQLSVNEDSCTFNMFTASRVGTLSGVKGVGDLPDVPTRYQFFGRGYEVDLAGVDISKSSVGMSGGLQIVSHRGYAPRYERFEFMYTEPVEDAGDRVSLTLQKFYDSERSEEGDRQIGLPIVADKYEVDAKEIRGAFVAMVRECQEHVGK